MPLVTAQKKTTNLNTGRTSNIVAQSKTYNLPTGTTNAIEAQRPDQDS